MKKLIILELVICFLNLDCAQCEVLSLEEKIQIFQELLKSRHPDLRFYIFSENYTHVLNVLETKQQITQYVFKLENIYSNYQYATGFKNLR